MANTTFYRKPFERFRHYTNCGDMIEKTYEGYYDLDGCMQLKETGEHNIYLDIQADKNACDINVLIARYASGDTEALNRVQGHYMDITNMPKNIHEVYNVIKRAQDDFIRLPVEVKQQFDNSFEKFLFTTGQDNWFEKTGIENPNEKKDVSEVKSDGE